MEQIVEAMEAARERCERALVTRPLVTRRDAEEVRMQLALSAHAIGKALDRMVDEVSRPWQEPGRSE